VVTTPNNKSDDVLYRPDIAIHYARSVRGSPMKLVTDSWLCCDPPRHLYAFNADNLMRVATRAGFDSAGVETAYWHEDPYGQPKYGYQGWTSPKRAAHSVLLAYTTVSGWLAKRLDRRQERGTTLICYLRAAA
jgi:hypothetical protein